jgi:hypothetical protein
MRIRNPEPDPVPAQNLDVDPDPDPDPGGGRSAKNVHPPRQNPGYAPVQHCFICRPSDSTALEDAGNEPRTVVTLARAVRFVIFGGFFITKLGSPDFSKIINEAHKNSSKNGASNSFWRVLQVFASFFPLPDDTENKSLHSSLDSEMEVSILIFVPVLIRSGNMTVPDMHAPK